MTAKPPEDSEAALRAKLPPEERRQVDPALSLARVGRVGVAILILVAIALLTVVLVVLNRTNEAGSPRTAQAPPVTTGAPEPAKPTAPLNGPGAKP
jgi:hypothetical protein